MEEAVYVLCALTALACSGLLLRNYRRTRARLLLWCGLFFATLVLENVILFLDLVVVPEIDLSLFRNLCALTGVLVLIYGLIWESN
jgi:hypothetical protein